MAKTSVLRLRVEVKQANAAIDQLKKKTSTLTAEVRRLDKSLKKMTGSAESSSKALKKSGNSMKKFVSGGRTANQMLLVMLKRLTVLTLLFKSIEQAIEGIKIAAEFSRQLSIIRAISGETKRSIDELNFSLRELAVDVGISITDIGEAALILKRAGKSVSEISFLLRKIADFSLLSGESIAESTDVVIRTLAQFELSIGSASHAMEVMVKQANAVRIDVTRLGEAMKFAAPVANSLGISLEETAAAVGVLGQAGIDATLAGTGLRGVLLTLQNPTNKARRALRALGLSADDVNPALVGLTGAFENFRKVGARALDLPLIFSRRQIGAAQVMLRNVDTLKKFTAQNKNAGDSLERLGDQIRNDMTGAIDRMKAAWEELLVSFSKSDTIIELFNSLASGIKDITRLLATLGIVSKEPLLKGVDLAALRLENARARLGAAETNRAANISFPSIGVDRQPKEFRKFIRSLDDEVAKAKDAVERAKAELATEQLKSIATTATQDFAKPVELLRKTINSSGIPADIKNLFDAVSKKVNETLAQGRRQKIVNKENAQAVSDIVKASVERLRVARLTTEEQRAYADAQKIINSLSESGLEVSKATADKINEIARHEQRVLSIRKREALIEDQRKKDASKRFEDTTKDIQAILSLVKGQRDALNLAMLSDDARKSTNEALAFANKLTGDQKKLALENLPALQGALELINKWTEAIRRSAENQNAYNDAVRDSVDSQKEIIRDLQQQLVLSSLEGNERRAQAKVFEFANSVEKDGLKISKERLSSLKSIIKTLLDQIQINKDLVKSRQDSRDSIEASRRIQNDFLTNLNRELDLSSKSESEQKAINAALEVRRQLISANVNVTDEMFNGFKRAAKATFDIIDAHERQKKAVEELQETYRSLGEAIGNGIGGALEDLIFTAKSFKDIMKAAFIDITKELFRLLVVKNIVAGLGNLFAGFGPSSTPTVGINTAGTAGIPNIAPGQGPLNIAHGAAFNTSGHRMAASGFVANSPFGFSTAGGGRGRLGESGIEAVLPLARVNGKLGVKADAGRQAPLVQNFNISTPDANSFRRSKRQIMDDMRNISFGRRSG